MIQDIQSIHFSGICGTAMASCAAALKGQGYQVTGSDQGAYPPMSTFLESQGIPISSPYVESNLAHAPDLVVIGNALSRGNPEVEYVLDNKLPYCSLPELLKEFFIRGKRSIVISGTHGKTTTTSLMAWVFESSGLNPSFLIGGVPHNFGYGARFTDSPWIILEGDEYDTAFFDKRSKFIHYLPEIAIINNLEFDHADIFTDLEAIQLSFKRFINIVPRNGLLLVNGDEPNLAPLIKVDHCPIQSFGIENNHDSEATEIQLGKTGSQFDVHGDTYQLPMVGQLNIRNALAVIACARHCGIPVEQIQKGLATFTGIKRRLEIRATVNDITIIDDFGHHPTAIKETIDALRVAYPEQRLWVAFEPRSNTTRRNIFQSDLANALSLADGVLISQVARLHLIEEDQRLDPEQLVADIRQQGKPCEYAESADSICAYLAEKTTPGDVVCIFSNGSFDDLHNKLELALAEQISG
ncbi:UDP-N-acetylmuramate:L-alanyl-gamma-D-glutamyl-meso-diaminopimelate ligase [Verrucomicrobia bacterium]|nr:UDP-N-acetylmuramate:L-alanyl-gamma-D-glutamyl-meso-diaminopimelate ligase [Verrucomicrobiota bacterium]MDA7657072.1 UDP-N-acetylmuramate:L-alanyl-gamma-D-glutamyl-meso-diaminopimelate ligase [Verrucomicrobiota bacterium]MDA7680321.1 UDP-N-acetylmuramate:L-alanyl-gamma-D-glutamyl-meso-diaminopimelate ligase [bacterium]